MSRTKKNKVFDLFKNDFKITFFYKPTLKEGDDFYYLILDEVIKLKIKEVNGAIVIDDVIPATTTYLKPIYEKIVRTIMAQATTTVLVSLIGNTTTIQQACITCGAPLIVDDRYITVSKGYYQKLTTVFGTDQTKYGFYLLSVADGVEEESTQAASNTATETKSENVSVPKVTNNTPIGVEPPLTRVTKILEKQLRKTFPNMRVESASSESIRCILYAGETFIVELAEGGLYIKEFVQERATSLNLIKLMRLLETFEEFISIQSNVYILSVQNAELNGLCRNKGYSYIAEEQKLPVNRLFKQAFTGYGTYQIIKN
jgi:hypothetical protein